MKYALLHTRVHNIRRESRLNRIGKKTKTEKKTSRSRYEEEMGLKANSGV